MNYNKDSDDDGKQCNDNHQDGTLRDGGAVYLAWGGFFFCNLPHIGGKQTRIWNDIFTTISQSPGNAVPIIAQKSLLGHLKGRSAAGHPFFVRSFSPCSTHYL